jgi:hypothetical protein
MNIDNINRVIAAVRDEPHHYKMVNWNSAGDRDAEKRITLARNNPCNTVGCFGGWMDALALCDIADGKMKEPVRRYDDDTNAQVMAKAFIGMEDAEPSRSDQLMRLMHMDFIWNMTRFDRLPDSARSLAGVRALEIFRDNSGKSDWTRALDETGLLPYMSHDIELEEFLASQTA